MSKKYANECKRVSAKHMLALDAGNNVYTCSISVESLIMILDFYLTLIKLSLFILNIQGYLLLILPSNFIFLLIIFVVPFLILHICLPLWYTEELGFSKHNPQYMGIKIT